MPPSSDTYGLADGEPPPPRKYVPIEDRRDDDDEEPPEETPVTRLMMWDPFPLLITVVVLTWVGLGLWARRTPAVGFALATAGLLTIVVGEIYLYAIIVRESGIEGGLLAYFFDWYRLIYLHMNIELTLRPSIVVFCGFLMVVTGVFGAVHRMKPPG